MYFLDGRFGGGSRLVAVLQPADFLVLVLSDSVLPCFRLLLCGEFHHMVHCYLALDRLAYLYLVLVIVVFITSFDNHYYDENEIEVGKPMNCQVAVNHVVELTAEEKAEARQNAVRRYQEEELRKLQNRSKPRTDTKATAQEVQQPNLFNF